MKKAVLLSILALSAILLITGCAKNDIASGFIPESVFLSEEHKTDDKDVLNQSFEEKSEFDVIPMVMVNGKLYYDTGKENTFNGRCGTPDGEITLSVDMSEIPEKDNESNFGTGFKYQYGINDTIDVFINEKWIVFEHRKGTGNQVKFGDRMIDADGLSKETITWLEWYNSLTDEEQLSISSIPSDLIEEAGPAKTEDADMPAAN